MKACLLKIFLCDENEPFKVILLVRDTLVDLLKNNTLQLG